MRLSKGYRLGLLFVSVVLASTMLPLPVSGQPRRLADYDLPGMQNPVSLETLDPWDVVQLIEFLAHRGGLNNIVIGQGVQGLTTKLKFDRVTVGEALDIVLGVNKLAYEVKGGILTIMTDQEYQATHGVSFYDNKKIKVIDLQYADPSRLAAMLEPIKSSIGTMVADPVTGTLILIDTPERIAEMERIVAKADIDTISRVVPTITKTFHLQYADVADVQPEITAVLTKDVGYVRVDPRTKTFIVTDLPHKMTELEKLVAVFDTRPKQVFLEAKIVQVRLIDEFQMGVNWQTVFEKVGPRFSLSTVSAPGSVDSAGSLEYKTIIGSGDLTVVLDALQTVSETKVLSNPHVAVLDGESAKVSVGTDEPYVETRVDELGEKAVGGTTVKFIPVGIILEVTPRITDDGMIMTTIRPEISSAEFKSFNFGTDPFGTPIVNEVPVVGKSFAETMVMVRSGETVIIAGMIENKKSTQERRVPLLGSIPLLGSLFRSTIDSVESRELVTFLSPRVVSGEAPHHRSADIRKQPRGLRK